MPTSDETQTQAPSAKLAASPVVLLIFDGFGARRGGADNAVEAARTPNFDALKAQGAYGEIDASERMVGLPDGQFGNSEVGHMNIGAGRVIEQDVTLIDRAFERGDMLGRPEMRRLLQSPNRPLHLLGLFSEGGVHAHLRHFWSILDLCEEARMRRVIVHPFLDGRDTPPRSAEPWLKRLDEYCAAHPWCSVGAVMGRYYAMDRDKRWDRVKLACDALTGTAQRRAESAQAALAMAYAAGENDEFVKPAIVGADGAIKSGDAVLHMNFRADRARELTSALTDPDFDGFERQTVLSGLHFVSMTKYGDQFPNPALFPPRKVVNGLGEVLSKLGLRQLRIAETEKYPHVTYFFSGGREEPFANESRILIPSPKVATYDLQPEMSAEPIAEAVADSVKNKRFEFVACNFANGDMVGHTGDMSATVKAVETLDRCLGVIAAALKEAGGELLLTADHGNCEQMFDAASNQPHTQHTVNPVPFLYVGRPAAVEPGGALKDVAPTILQIMGLKQPPEMTGRPLLRFAR